MSTIQQISDQEWEQHKEVLKDLYCSEGLALQGRKGKANELGVIELMTERHGFSAR